MADEETALQFWRMVQSRRWEMRVWRVMSRKVYDVCQYVVEHSRLWHDSEQKVRQHCIFAWLRAVRILWQYFKRRSFANTFSSMEDKDYYNFLCIATVSIACKTENDTSIYLQDIASTIQFQWTQDKLSRLADFEMMLLAEMDFSFTKPTAACFWAETRHISLMAKWLQYVIVDDPTILELSAQEMARLAETTLREWRSTFAL